MKINIFTNYANDVHCDSKKENLKLLFAQIVSYFATINHDKLLADNVSWYLIGISPSIRLMSAKYDETSLVLL